jgi:hypothetical protein
MNSKTTGPTARPGEGDGIGDVCDAEVSRMTERFVWLPWLGMALVGGLLTAMFIQVRRRA